jgi:hypothetical protein
MHDRPADHLLLLDDLRSKIRARHLSHRTEQAYASWVERYIRFHRGRHPARMGTAEIEAFLTYLSARRGVAASTHNQAACALLFLYRKVRFPTFPKRHRNSDLTNHPNRLRGAGRPVASHNIPRITAARRQMRRQCLLHRLS